MSNQQVMPAAAIEPPADLPDNLIGDFDVYAAPELAQCPYRYTFRLHEGPPIVWVPDRRSRGAWQVSRAADIRFVMNNPQIFSSREAAGFSQLIGERWDMIPLELDPPEHTKFRKVMNPILAPAKVAQMAPGVTARAVELIETVREKGGCEFMEAFGQPFPVSIFMQLMGLPSDQMGTFLRWEKDLLFSPDPQDKARAAKEIRDYLVTLGNERRANPTGDLTSYVVQAEVDGRPFSDDEILGTLYLLFVGGLDTVASTLGFVFRHLAEDQEHQAWLRANPDRVEKAIEELIRRFTVVSTRRRVMEDVELGGVQMKRGDWVAVTFAAGSIDPNEFLCPLDVDFDRKNVRHFGFGFGPHFCIGNHLARRELVVALHEWLARIPQWRVRPGSEVIQHGGGVFGVDLLELEW
ncbi:MAG: cytochrome P450 [Rhizorhabdus sp.]